MTKSTTAFSVTFSAILFTGCGGGGGGSDGGTNPPPIAAPPAVVDEAIGGIWVGTDNSGLEILALSTESGDMRWLAPQTGEQGFGQGAATGSAVSFDYTYVAPIGFALDDGSTFADCSATGTIDERTSLAVTTNCTTGLGGSFSNSAALSYDALYDRDSSLATIAGTYDNFGSVISVDAAGVIFEQDPASGCVVNGQATIIDPEYNAYGVSITYSNCTGTLSVLNGSSFNGLATLDNTVVPETAIAGLTGVVDGVTFSVVFVLPRI